MSRRARGEGTIFQRQDGLWQAAITLGYDGHGRQIRKTVYGATQRVVREKIEAIKREGPLPALAGSVPTLGHFLEQWLAEKRNQVKPRTFESYAYTARHYLVPRLGHVRLNQLTAYALQRQLSAIAGEISPHTANYCRSLLFSALRQAVRWQFLPANPMDGVDRLREATREMALWTPAQVRAFLKEAEGDPLAPLFFLALSTGLRLGELLGLRWADVQADHLMVRRTLARNAGSLALSVPKTDRSYRVVVLDPDAQRLLAEHRARQIRERALLADAWAHPEHVFVTAIGTYLDPRNVLRTFHRLQDRAGVPRARFHDLRHLHVSLLVRHGFDVRTIADRVGHTNPSFTLKQYTHLFDAQRRAAAVPLAMLLAEGDAKEE